MVDNVFDILHIAQRLCNQWELELSGDVLKHSDAWVNPRLKLKSLEVGFGQQHFLKTLALWKCMFMWKNRKCTFWLEEQRWFYFLQNNK